MKGSAKIVLRIAAIAIAAGLSIGISGIWARSMSPPMGREQIRLLRRPERPRGPERLGAAKFAFNSLLFAGIVFGGRRILGLKLSD